MTDNKAVEKASNEFNFMLFGAIKVVKLVIQQYPQLKEKYGNILIQYLLKD